MADHPVAEAVRRPARTVEWRDVEPDLPAEHLAKAALGCASVLHLALNWMSGVRLYVTEACLNEVCLHVGSCDEEVGGLLIGRALAVRGADTPVVLVEGSLASLEFLNSPVSLEMGAEVWGRAHAAFDQGRRVVGWYHSHPNLGAFFSGTDRSTQRAFFSQPYSLGWVIDPERVEQKVFIGKDADEYPFPMVVLADEPAVISTQASKTE